MKNLKIFYGWWIVVAAFFISAYANGVVTFSFTAVLEPIIKEFKWSYARTSFAASIRGFETSLLGPLIGILFDRFGPRRLIFIGGILIGLGLFLLSRTNSIIVFYIAFFLMTTGQGACTGFILTTAVGNWFRRRISLVAGITLCGGAVGGLLVPLVTKLIDIYEWRDAMVIIGSAALCIILPLSLIIRHKPEHYGLLPDGDEAIEPLTPEIPAAEQKPETGPGIKQVLSSRAFWHISLGFMCHLLALSSVLTHIMPYLGSIDIPRSSASFVASAIPIVSIVGRISFGWLGEKSNKKLLVAVGYILTLLGLLVLAYIDTLGEWSMILFIILLSLGYGGPIPVAIAMLLEHFGRARFSTVVGTSMGVLMIGNILGPPLAGWVYDTYDSYRGAWIIFCVVTAVGMMALLTTPKPKSTP